VEADKAKEEAKYNSQSVTVITKEDIARKQGKSVEDVIFNEVGVTRTVDAMGKVGISIRGADPRHTLIMVDGQPVLGDVSKYSGNGDELMRIGAENIERIEIIRGAASAKYGSDAIGGVVNVITKGPKNMASVQFNAEGRYHNSRYYSSNESSALPSNFFLRADSGKVGNFRVAGWTSKRYVMPVYSKERVFGWEGYLNWPEDFKPSLRYYGDVRDTGVSGEYAFNEEHKISFKFQNEDSNLERRNKNVTAPIGGLYEPMQKFKRNIDRDTYNVTYNGKSGKTDWTIDVNHGKTYETNTALKLRALYAATGSHTMYSGQNELYSVDWLKHRVTNVNVGLNTAINDKHYMSYGVGYTTEKAEGTRLQSAPKIRISHIDPWDYDKSLKVADNTAGKDDVPVSDVHNYVFDKTYDDKGNLKNFVWNKGKEYYGEKKPPLTYEEAVEIKNKYPAVAIIGSSMITDPELRKKYEDFNKVLMETNDLNGLADAGKISEMETRRPAFVYYFGSKIPEGEKYIKFNGTYYGQGFDERQNQVVVGEAEMKKSYAYVQDNWQITPNTMITPSLRLDHSDLFGSQVTGNVGLTHNLNDNPKRRLKANIGTGYAEPGLGELYYNWEMFGGTMGNVGWYWIGNPNLKPEKSLNFDVSLEGEGNKTFAKVSLFHNDISDYMTAYFTGQLIDFNFNGQQYRMNPDRIYSFRNLGKAKITGLEAEVQQKFNDHWSAKLGYTWLHAINDSDEDMPRKLLDRPTHKFDISLNYKNTEGDFRGALWGSYYVHMLDSNSVKTDDLYDQDSNGNYLRKAAQYKEKSFGLWNLMLEKDFGKDLTAYVGVDNIFDHRDDDRAFQDRVYRFGINMKLEDLGKALSQPFHIRKDKEGNPIITNVYGDDWFLSRTVDRTRKAGDVDFYGDYRVRSNMFKGADKAEMRATKEAQASAGAAKNNADKPGHGLEQRLRLGIDYQIADGLNLNIAGSTAKRDTAYSVAEKRGLHDPYLEKAELTKSTKKWDWSVGRISEPMGVTGYWFGKEYDGARIVYTDHKTQVSLGYGDFSQTTGITDSAYNHNEVAVIQRAPNFEELIGLNIAITGGIYSGLTYDPEGKFNYREKFDNAKTPEEKLQVVKEMLHILKDVDAAAKLEDASWQGFYGKLVDVVNPNGISGSNLLHFNSLNLQIKTAQGTEIDLTDRNQVDLIVGKTQYQNQSNILSGFSFEDTFNVDKVKARFAEILDQAGAVAYYTTDGTQLNNKNEAVDHIFASYVGTNTSYKVTDFSKPLKDRVTFYGDGKTYNAISKIFNAVYTEDLKEYVWNYQNKDTVPLPGAPITFSQEGYLLKQDVIPAMDRAAYIKVRRQLSDTVGVEAWKLNSFSEGAQDAHGLHDMQIADVLGIGTQIRLGKRSMLSFDYGQNRADMGEFFHGGRDIYGDYTGGGHTPDFWVARLDIGIADTDMPGSWHAYLDYKAFDHGSFVGGTGADLPDRYLDGIRSFTTGIGYVPARNLLLEASYTFGAKSMQMRDTLYTPENFRLGDYTRVQMTYKF
jgi:outer membrane receptor for ferrienterochelin and colicin